MSPPSSSLQLLFRPPVALSDKHFKRVPRSVEDMRPNQTVSFYCERDVVRRAVAAGTRLTE